MSLKRRVRHELEALAVATVYFGCWIGALLLLKTLLLAEYDIPFHRWSILIIGVLVLAKVVLVLEHVSCVAVLRGRPAWADAMARTALHSLGVVGVLLLERGISERQEHGGVLAAMEASIRGANTPHFWVNAICITGALAGYNLLSVVRRQLGDRAMFNLFVSPLPARHPQDLPPAPTEPAP